MGVGFFMGFFFSFFLWVGDVKCLKIMFNNYLLSIVIVDHFTRFRFRRSCLKSNFHTRQLLHYLGFDTRYRLEQV